MLILPYRVKNPWKHFPYATLSIIALNVLVYAFTTESFLVIREAVVDEWAFEFGVTSPLTLFTAMFLHGDIFHLLGNMLFFWVFGPAVEDRLGVPMYLGMYFIAGITGDILQTLLDVTMGGTTIAGIGASGCIMGVLGAYAYLYTWSTVCVFYWIFWFVRGVWEIAALWVIGTYLFLDLLQGVLAGSAAGGVAHFVHVGGGLTGAFICYVFSLKRDTHELSQVKKSQAEIKDITLLSPEELDLMRQADPENPAILRAMFRGAANPKWAEVLRGAFKEAGPALVEKDPGLVMQYLIRLHGDPKVFRASHLMRLGRFAEGLKDPSPALEMYSMVGEHFPNTPENEMALYRMALYFKDRANDPARARGFLEELLQKYPFGACEQHANALLKELR